MNLLFTILFIAFCNLASAQDIFKPARIRKPILALVAKLPAYSDTAMTEYLENNYDTVFKKATDIELYELTNHPNPLVRRSSFYPLLQHHSPKVLDLLQKNANDTVQYFQVQNGCFMDKQTFLDELLFYLSPQSGWDRHFKMSEAQKQAVAVMRARRENVLQATLRTGYGFPRTLERDSTLYYINPIPIIDIKNITELDIYQANDSSYALLMKFDEQGRKIWAKATETHVGLHLAFVVDDIVLHTPRVARSVHNGIASLNRGIYSKQELEQVKRTLENEKTKCPMAKTLALTEIEAYYNKEIHKFLRNGDSLTPDALIDFSVKWFNEIKAKHVSTEKDKDKDMLLFQYGTYDWGDDKGKHFSFEIARQFVLDDSEEFFQLRFTLIYDPKDFTTCESDDMWNIDFDSMDQWIENIKKTCGYERAVSIPIKAYEIKLEQI
ncbi:MAG: hypothetical protein K0Q66_1847 [Chitinophagaceae bacterium]|nr:hypothetical protein [Chitinophagaceae bacterium]